MLQKCYGTQNVQNDQPKVTGHTRTRQNTPGPGRTRQLSRQKPMIGSLSPFNGIVQQLLIYYGDQGVQCYSLRVNHGFVEQSL